MSNQPLVLLTVLVAFGTASALLLGGAQESPAAPEKVSSPPPSSTRPSLAGQARHYTPISFDDIFVTPAGPLGLSYTSKCQNLAGKAIMIDGHMVRHHHEDTSVFLFAPLPTVHNQTEYMLADSLPPSLVHVVMQVRPGDAPAWRPQRLTVMGRLEIGPRQEVDGRVSHARLFCDHVADSKTLEAVELRKPLALQRDRMVAGPQSNFRPQHRTIPAEASHQTTTTNP